jgi:hypothetical protein
MSVTVLMTILGALTDRRTATMYAALHTPAILPQKSLITMQMQPSVYKCLPYVTLFSSTAAQYNYV